MSWLTPTVRLWFYSVCLAVFGVLAVYGLMDERTVAAWAVLAAAVSGVAMAHVPPTDEPPTEPRHAEDE